MNIEDLTPHIGKTISFKLYPEAIISDDFTDVLLEGITNWQQVSFIDPIQKHVNVYPTLPAGTPNDYRGYLYAIVRLPLSNETTAVGLPWINESTFRASSTTDIIVTIRGRAITDIDTIRNILTAQGFTNISIDTHSN